jgi:hypothetical protein
MESPLSKSDPFASGQLPTPKKTYAALFVKQPVAQLFHERTLQANPSQVLVDVFKMSVFVGVLLSERVSRIGLAANYNNGKSQVFGKGSLRKRR